MKCSLCSNGAEQGSLCSKCKESYNERFCNYCDASMVVLKENDSGKELCHCCIAKNYIDNLTKDTLDELDNLTKDTLDELDNLTLNKYKASSMYYLCEQKELTFKEASSIYEERKEQIKFR